MLIAKSLRFPTTQKQFQPTETGPYPARLIAAVKIKFDDLRGFFRSRKKLPFLHRVLTSLYQQRVAAENTGTAHVSVRRDNDFNLHLAGDAHAPREFGINGRSLGFDLALALLATRRLRESGRRQHEQRDGWCRDPSPTKSHCQNPPRMGTERPRNRKGTSN